MPRRFVFRLQPVLEQRERLEERAQLRVAEIERQRLGVEQTLKAIQTEVLDTRKVLRGGLHGGPGRTSGSMTDVRLAANQSLHLTVRAQRAAMELAGVLKRLELARAELLKASADRKAVQLLKDRAQDEFRREQLKREMAELDEMVVMRHGRADQLAAAGLAEGSDES
jgi:flagellar FliJ protein